MIDRVRCGMRLALGGGFVCLMLVLLAAPCWYTEAGSQKGAMADWTGAWQGTLRPITQDHASNVVPFMFEVHEDMRVSGCVGGAELVNARIRRHPWVYRRLFRHATEYNIQAKIKGTVLDGARPGWNRVYIHLRRDPDSGIPAIGSIIVSVNGRKRDMMPMQPVTFERANDQGTFASGDWEEDDAPESWDDLSGAFLGGRFWLQFWPGFTKKGA